MKPNSGLLPGSAGQIIRRALSWASAPGG
jgi:hypothetical protein